MDLNSFNSVEVMAKNLAANSHNSCIRDAFLCDFWIAEVNNCCYCGDKQCYAGRLMDYLLLGRSLSYDTDFTLLRIWY